MGCVTFGSPHSAVHVVRVLGSHFHNGVERGFLLSNTLSLVVRSGINFGAGTEFELT